MVRGAVTLAVLLTIGASGVSLASEAPFLGDWARGDGKTRIRVASCGAAFCGVNTWVRPGVSGEKVGDTLVAKVTPAGAGRWSGTAFDRRRNQHYTMKIHVANNHMTTQGACWAGLCVKAWAGRA
jgi:uncharacterized protein (DUF2147 family)